MKKIASLLLCLMMVLPAASCGKDNTSSKSVNEDVNQTVEEQQGENAGDKDLNDNVVAENSESEAEAEVQALPVESAEQLESMVDEFNNTDDPERKEELRKELEKILQQAQEVSVEK